MPKFRWRDTRTGRFIRAPLGVLSALLKMLTVREKVK